MKKISNSLPEKKDAIIEETITSDDHTVSEDLSESLIKSGENFTQQNHFINKNRFNTNIFTDDKIPSCINYDIDKLVISKPNNKFNLFNNCTYNSKKRHAIFSMKLYYNYQNDQFIQDYNCKNINNDEVTKKANYDFLVDPLSSENDFYQRYDSI